MVKVNDNVPLFIKDIATVSLGPEMRRGVLDKEGAEVVGGVVVVRFGENPLQVIKNVKEKIKEIGPGLAQQDTTRRQDLARQNRPVLRPHGH